MLRARPEAQAHPAGAVEGPAAQVQPVPVAAAASRDLATDEDLGAGPSLFRGLPFQEGDPEDGRAFQRHRRARGYTMNELGMDPFFQLHHWKPGVLSPDAELGRTIQHADQELFGHVAWQLIERREAATLALLEGKSVHSPPTRRPGGPPGPQRYRSGC